MKIFVLFLFAVSAKAQSYLLSYEGYHHCSIDGVAGVCTYLKSCPSALNDLQNNKRPQICDFIGIHPIVCCIQSGPSVTPKPVLTTTKSNSDNMKYISRDSEINLSNDNGGLMDIGLVRYYLSRARAKNITNITADNINYIGVGQFGNVSVKYFNLPEGSQCMTENIRGTCVKMVACDKLIADIMDPTRSHKRYPDICSYDAEDPIVCCTSCETISQNISNAVLTRSGVLMYKTGQKLWDKCLDYSKYATCSKRNSLGTIFIKGRQCYIVESTKKVAIAGGQPAGRDEYTHMALLGYGTSTRNAKWSCGGSLISEKFILTAGHCISAPHLGPVTYASLGMLKRSDPESLWQTYKIKTIIKHPDYRPPTTYHDIALLETDTLVKFSQKVLPACLMAPSGLSLGIEEPTILGWGATGNNQDVADSLQVINVKPYDEDDCKKQYRPHRHYLRGYDATTQLCFGGSDAGKPADTCSGDSGGPLQYYGTYLCMFFVTGVTSFGRGCGFTEKAGIYTRVHYYAPWIESVVWPDP